MMADGGDGLPGTVGKAAYLGKHLEYTIASPVGELFVIDRRVDAPRAVGSGVTLRFGDRIALVPGEGRADETGERATGHENGRPPRRPPLI